MGELLPRISIRYYSISSSSGESPSAISIVFISVKYPVFQPQFNGKELRNVIKEGLTTSWLSRLHDYYADILSRKTAPVQLSAGGVPPIYIPLCIRTSNMQLPDNHKIPIIMVGPGTGVAPFRGFIKERIFLAENGMLVGDMILFNGCRNENNDYIYKEDFQKMLKAAQKNSVSFKIITAFSRDTIEKVYVQNKVAQYGETVWDLLQNKNGSFFVCGEAKSMAHAIYNTLIAIASAHGGLSLDSATNWVQKLKDDCRYVEDVWS